MRKEENLRLKLPEVDFWKLADEISKPFLEQHPNATRVGVEFYNHYPHITLTIPSK